MNIYSLKLRGGAIISTWRFSSMCMHHAYWRKSSTSLALMTSENWEVYPKTLCDDWLFSDVISLFFLWPKRNEIWCGCIWWTSLTTVICLLNVPLLDTPKTRSKPHAGRCSRCFGTFCILIGSSAPVLGTSTTYTWKWYKSLAFPDVTST